MDVFTWPLQRKKKQEAIEDEGKIKTRAKRTGGGFYTICKPTPEIEGQTFRQSVKRHSGARAPQEG